MKTAHAEAEKNIKIAVGDKKSGADCLASLAKVLSHRK